MAIASIRTSGQINHLLTTNVATASFVIPATAVPGDIAIFCMGSNTATGTFSTPAGFTAYTPVVSSSAYTTQVFAKKLIAADIGATVTSTSSISGRVHGVWVIIKDAKGVPAAAQVVNLPDTSAGATIATPNVTAVSANSFVLNFGMIRSATTGARLTVTVDAAATESTESDTNFAAASIPNFSAVAARRNSVIATAGGTGGAGTFTSSDAGSTGQGWSIAFEGAADAAVVGYIGSALPVYDGSTATTVNITLPTGADVGHVAVLVLEGSEMWTNTAPAGWSKVTSQAKPGICLDIWTKTLVAGDLTGPVTITSNNDIAYKRTVKVHVFSNAIVGNVLSATETVAQTAHAIPRPVAADSGAWALVGVADRASPGSTAWTLAAELTSRSQYLGSGGGSVSSVDATDDFAGPGTIPAYTITGTVSTATAVMYAVVIEPSTAVVSGSVNAGADIYSEPRVTFSRTATASGGTVTSWAWSQTSPASPVLTLSGANTATVSFTLPPAIGPVTFTLRVVATFSGGGTATGDFTVTVYPVTKRFVTKAGVEVPLRVYKVI